MSTIRLKKGEDRRIRHGHPWIFSNEINTTLSPLKSFTRGQTVRVEGHDGRFLGMAYINPQSLICGRLYSRTADEVLNTDFLTNKLRAALTFRDTVFKEPYYRLVFSEGDDMPGVVVDRFGDDLVVQINTAGMETVKTNLIDALRTVLPNTRSILLRNDSPIREQEGLTTYVEAAFGEPPETLSIRESGVNFVAPLRTGQKTGWFYDHRLNRARLREYVSNKRVLDVFSYVGAWGLQAAMAGAKEVDCIDASRSACDFIKQNAVLNQVSDRVTVICEDAFDALKRLLQAGKQYDVIVLDPPAFVKKAKDRQEGMVAYQRLNEMALKLLSSHGVLVACSCSMHISMEDMMTLLERAAFNTGEPVQVIERGHQGPDHPLHLVIPETEYLKAVFARKMR